MYIVYCILSNDFLIIEFEPTKIEIYSIIDVK